MSPAQHAALSAVAVSTDGLLPPAPGLGATLHRLRDAGLIVCRDPLPGRGGHYADGCYRALLTDAGRLALGLPVLPSAPMPRGGARKGAGRKPRTSAGASTTRPGVPMTDEEWAPVVAYAEANGITNAEACRRLIALGLKAADG